MASERSTHLTLAGVRRSPRRRHVTSTLRRSWTYFATRSRLFKRHFSRRLPSRGLHEVCPSLAVLRRNIGVWSCYLWSRGRVQCRREPGLGWIGAMRNASFSGPPASAPETRPGFDDSLWQIVDAPHDAMISGSYSRAEDPNWAFLPSNGTGTESTSLCRKLGRVLLSYSR